MQGDLRFPQGPVSTESFHDFYSVLSEMQRSSNPVDERRGDRRVPRSISLQVQPLDMDFQPEGESFCAITRDISKRGLGFINAEAVDHEYLRIYMPLQTESSVIARVCYNLSIGVTYPLYLVGVEFIS